MVRMLAAGLTLAFVLATAHHPLVARQEQPTFRGTADMVRVFVTATDGDGRLVTTLTRDDFEIRDEGKPQPIALFDNTPQPIRAHPTQPFFCYAPQQGGAMEIVPGKPYVARYRLVAADGEPDPKAAAQWAAEYAGVE